MSLLKNMHLLHRGSRLTWMIGAMKRAPQNEMFVFDAKPEFNLVAQNRIAGDDSQFNATPAIAERRTLSALQPRALLYRINAACRHRKTK